MTTGNELATNTAKRRWLSVIPAVLLLGVIAWQGTIAARYQERAKEEQQRTEIIIASSGTATVMCNSRHQITVVNPAAERMFGWSKSEMLGKPIEMLMPEELRQVHEKAMAEAGRKAASMPGDWLIRKELTANGLHRDGHEFPVDLEIRTIKYGEKVEFIAGMKRRDAPKPTFDIQRLPPIPTIQERVQESPKK